VEVCNRVKTQDLRKERPIGLMTDIGNVDDSIFGKQMSLFTVCSRVQHLKAYKRARFSYIN